MADELTILTEGQSMLLELEGYSDLEPIGAGGFSLVYRGRQEKLNRLVAIKILTAPAVTADTQRRFMRECQIAGAVSNHPNIVTLHDAGIATSGQPYLVFEYMDGGSLATRISTAPAVSADEAAGIAMRLAGALAAIHAAGILHRDVKPGNVLFSAYGEPCLSDFGISFVESTLHATSMTSSLTPLYSAPEVVDGTSASAASDIYSLGATLYAALAGHAPHTPGPGEGVARTLMRIMHDPVPPLDRRDVPASMWQTIEAMLGKDPSARPSASEVAHAMAGHSSSIGTRPASVSPDSDLTVRRTPPSGPLRPSPPEPPTVRQTDRSVARGSAASSDRADLARVVGELFPADARMRSVIEGLSPAELDLAMPCLRRLPEYVVPSDVALMGWATLAPEEGLLLACNTGLITCPNSGPADGDILTRADIGDFAEGDGPNVVDVFLRSGDEIRFVLVEGEADLLAGYLQLLITSRKRRIVADFDQWVSALS